MVKFKAAIVCLVSMSVMLAKTAMFIPNDKNEMKVRMTPWEDLISVVNNSKVETIMAQEPIAIRRSANEAFPVQVIPHVEFAITKVIISKM